MKKYLYSYLIISILLIGCAKNDAIVTTPAEETFSTVQLTNAANYSREKGGSGILIMENDSIIFEDYHNGADQNTATHIHSATKLFWVAAAALAKQQGLISDYNEYVSSTITEWQDNALHPNKNQIQLKHLLTLSSGLSQDFLQLSNESNTYQHVIDALHMVNTPGEKFTYGPSNFYVFGVLLERKLHNNGISQDPLQYLTTEIFDKIGLEYESWAHDASGNPNIPNGCTLTPRNWVKYGQFLLHKGKWNGEQIIDSELLDEMFIPTGPNPGFGNFCWLNRLGGYGLNTSDSAPTGSLGGFIYYNGYTEIIGGLGAGKNRMYLIPSLNMVIIRQTLLEEDTFEDNEFLELLLN